MKEEKNYLEEIPECPKLSKKEQDDFLFLMELFYKNYFREYFKGYSFEREYFIKKILGKNYKEIRLKDDLKKRGFEKWL